MSIRHIVYISRLADRAGSAAVHAIVRDARTNNAIRGITGALMFDGEHFCQYLEGGPDEVVRTWLAIERDPRHGMLRTLASGGANDRRFAAWSMAYVSAVPRGSIASLVMASGSVADAFGHAFDRCIADA